MKAYFNNSVISFLPLNEAEKPDLDRVLSKQDVYDIITEFITGETPSDLCLRVSNYNCVTKYFIGYFKYLSAAGGIVKNEDGDYLLIKRFGKWDLPKGKIEHGEGAEDAAIREVNEETAICGLKIVDKLPDTYHIYEQNEKWYLKKTYWYSMYTHVTRDPIPQTSEDIVQAVWLNKKLSRNAIANSYRSIADTFKSFFM
ncbi:MAG: NUDIX domain-containing protein [Lentimicrobiaceae bacterium]|jgi:ADP-ribose pyrophosphatase YjhB (NUDIX family)|nr:NUDIX domain-containing protein [Lentimicrobiaceae bacterium]MCP4911371.1 NUDIX domain-containing protein [Bacteroidota bacterium]MBT3453819.1 NUDIX domain-containing protein [Lentimicrobiaceae bacterium]MBT3819498.1 NUDIX domain-containing protein [Lentimicrobiaceae bacterium]MBT4061639.1 NUDIX domain-containing protein [Lentimicrobiaceae bacterium]